VQALDAGHELSLLWRLDAIGETDQAGADFEWAEEDKARTSPAGGEDVQVQAGAVEQMKEPMVGLATEVQDAHEAGDPGVVGTTAQAHQYEKHPKEGARAMTGGSQKKDRLQPLGP